ncbi:MAG: putative hydrolase, CocE/NonD family [Herbinix sp.]|nr:putative hydrolase, CocE/NonD family [Herbinix sp.]
MFLRNINNGWEMTPRYRIEVTDAFDCDYQTNRPEKEFPLARTEYQKLYLDSSNMSLAEEPIENEAKVSYDANEGVANFDFQFDKQTEITGYMKLRLWVEADGHDEMDMFVNIQKTDENGNWLPTYILGEPHPGSWGKMRVSHRVLDEKLSTDYEPVQSHLKEEKLSPGEIVPVDIAIVPSSKIWHKGQKLRVQVAGRYIREGWFEPLAWETDNKGSHVIHTGGKYESFLQIPVIPPKYQAGDYIYR